MKIALLLPGYLDSPDYLHMKMFEVGLMKLGYTVERLDPCHLWETGDVNHYSITNFLKQIEIRVNFYRNQNFDEIVLVGHSMGAHTAIIAGSRIDAITRIVALCPPPDRKESVHKWIHKAPRVSKRDLPDYPGKFRTFAIPYSYVEDALQYSAVEEVKKINKPLMIFIALDDVVVPPVQTEKIVTCANSPYVVRQNNMGHDFRQSQDDCNTVMRHIEKFLTDTSS